MVNKVKLWFKALQPFFIGWEAMIISGTKSTTNISFNIYKKNK
jgi:hypothetical protein